MFEELKEINARPKPFEFYTADELWTNEHTIGFGFSRNCCCSKEIMIRKFR